MCIRDSSLSLSDGYLSVCLSSYIFMTFSLFSVSVCLSNLSPLSLSFFISFPIVPVSFSFLGFPLIRSPLCFLAYVALCIRYTVLFSFTTCLSIITLYQQLILSQKCWPCLRLPQPTLFLLHNKIELISLLTDIKFRIISFSLALFEAQYLKDHSH